MTTVSTLEAMIYNNYATLNLPDGSSFYNPQFILFIAITTIHQHHQISIDCGDFGAN